MGQWYGLCYQGVKSSWAEVQGEAYGGTTAQALPDIESSSFSAGAIQQETCI